MTLKAEEKKIEELKLRLSINFIKINSLTDILYG